MHSLHNIFTKDTFHLNMNLSHNIINSFFKWISHLTNIKLLENNINDYSKHWRNSLSLAFTQSCLLF